MGRYGGVSVVRLFVAARRYDSCYAKQRVLFECILFCALRRVPGNQRGAVDELRDVCGDALRGLPILSCIEAIIGV